MRRDFTSSRSLDNVSGFPISASTSKIPGLTALPVAAMRAAWINAAALIRRESATSRNTRSIVGSSNGSASFSSASIKDSTCVVEIRLR